MFTNREFIWTFIRAILAKVMAAKPDTLTDLRDTTNSGSTGITSFPTTPSSAANSSG